MAKLEVYIPDDMEAEYMEAKEKLAKDYYADKLSEDERDKLYYQVAKWLLIKKFEGLITTIAEGGNPYDYDDDIYSDVEKEVEKEAHYEEH